jgi:hypothetical protein
MLAVLIVLASLVVVLLLRRRGHPGKRVPSPFALPLLGNLPQAMKREKNRLFRACST